LLLACNNAGMDSVRIKICGVTRAHDIEAVEAAGAHAVGINFFSGSSRFIGSLERAAQLRREAKVKKLLWAGVFVNASAEEIAAAVQCARLDIVQLHGDETSDFSRALRARLGREVQIWKAFPVGAPADLFSIADFDCDATLLDAKCGSVRGGSGKSFDWSILQRLKRTRPLVLAGGLKPETVAAAVSQVAPDWIDTASGVESAPGQKDKGCILQFVQAASSARTR